MRIAAESFRGEAPRVTPRALPENGAQLAKNARLQSGDLESWRQFVLAKILANPAAVETIYLLNDEWLSWSVDVDAARGAIPGDNTYRLYLTAPDLYAQPRFTNYALATTGAEPFPVTTRPLGVPSPDAQPTTVVGVSTTPGATTITVEDAADQFESWSVSPQVGYPGAPNQTISLVIPQSSPEVGYAFDSKLNYPNNVPYLYRDFGMEGSTSATFSCEFLTNSSIGHGRGAATRIQCDASGNGAQVGVGYPYGIGGGLKLYIASTAGWSAAHSYYAAADVSIAMNVWYRIEVTYTKVDSLVTIAARLYQDSTLLAETQATSYFTTGGFYGLSNPVNDDNHEYFALFRNIIAQANVPAGVLSQTATSYVYTFVNDLGEESAPSPPSATVLMTDGSSVTVTTSVAVPSGFSVDYAVETKRIYRSVTGNTGTAFLFVAEIPVGQADYVDELADSELGDQLETELWDLPPDDLRGILALPNGIMVGFRRNQLCFSAQNRPHAWPVDWRLNTDVPIVAIGNIDNTVVIGTEAFPYLAVGNDPSAYSMSKLEVPQACVSKQSLAYLTKIGVVFASPDGLIAISGNGQVSNLTETIFTRRQWQDLVPTTIRGVAHDDVYHFFSGTVNVGGGGGGFTPVFSDNLTTETVAALSSHTPQVVPAGWGGWTLIGAGHWRTDTGQGATAADPNDLSIGDIGFFTGVVANAAFAMEWEVDSFIDGEASFDTEQCDFSVFFDPPGDDTVLRMRWIPGDTLNPAGQFNVLWNGVTLGGGSGNFTVPALSGNVPHTIFPRLVVTPTSLTLSGVGVDPYVQAGDFSWMTTIYGVVISENNIDGTGSAEFRVVNLQIETGTESIPVDNTKSYMLDMKPSGFGLVELGYHATAAHADPLTDQLYLVLDAVSEPNEPYMPLPSTAPDVSGQGAKYIYAFDSPNAYGDMVYQYRGKLNLLPRPGAFCYCQVKADDYLNLLMNFYADGSLLFSQVITSKEVFTLPMLDEYETFEVEFVGTSRVQSYQVAEDVNELT